MQKYLRAQAVVDNDDQGMFENIFNQAVLEINPNHPIIQKLKQIQESKPDSEEGQEMIDLVFNTAALSAGYVLDNAAEYSQTVIKMMTRMSQ
jgi:molecular chaperone HtpG